MKWLALFFALTTTASAQDFTMSVVDTKFQADWNKVILCAKKPYPKIDWTNDRLRQLGDSYYQSISQCRWALAERQAVWVEAGRSAESNPFPPISMENDQDFKRDMVCDYSGLDKNGAGIIHCNVDKW